MRSELSVTVRQITLVALWRWMRNSKFFRLMLATAILLGPRRAAIRAPADSTNL